MLFAIINDKPYLIHDGKAYPVSIENGETVTVEKSGKKTKEIGRYTLREVVAKIGLNVSSVNPKKKAEE